jgi:hypothetical protein
MYSRLRHFGQHFTAGFLPLVETPGCITLLLPKVVATRDMRSPSGQTGLGKWYFDNSI